MEGDERVVVVVWVFRGLEFGNVCGGRFFLVIIVEKGEEVGDGEINMGFSFIRDVRLDKLINFFGFLWYKKI